MELKLIFSSDFYTQAAAHPGRSWPVNLDPPRIGLMVLHMEGFRFPHFELQAFFTSSHIRLATKSSSGFVLDDT